MKFTTGNFKEVCSLAETFSEAKFDKDKFKISNVVLLGPESKNNRRYTEKCMRNAVSLYEGAKAFVNHPSTEEEKRGNRDVRNLAGKFVNVRFDEGTKKIKADFAGLPNGNGQMYMDIAEHMPDVAGNSQNASGKWRVAENGQRIVDEITKVISVDLVSNPATTAGMFESTNDNNSGVDTMEYKDVTLAGLRENRPDLMNPIDTETKTLKEERDNLKTKVDEFEVKEAAVIKRENINKMLEEAKLPKEAVTDTFVESLERAEDEAGIKKMIEDRKSLISTAKGGVKGMGGDRNAETGGKVLEDKQAHANFRNKG